MGAAVQDVQDGLVGQASLLDVPAPATARRSWNGGPRACMNGTARALALARHGQVVRSPESVIKDPFVLAFLELPERHTWLEHDLEQAIIERIEDSCWNWARGSASSLDRSG